MDILTRKEILVELKLQGCSTLSEFRERLKEYESLAPSVQEEIEKIEDFDSSRDSDVMTGRCGL